MNLLRRISKYGFVGLAQETRAVPLLFLSSVPTIRVSRTWGQDLGFGVETTLKIAPVTVSP